MRAVVVRSYGGPEVLDIATIPVPRPAPDEVLVEVAAAPVTPVDIDTRQGHLTSLLGEPDPYHALGRSAGGTVVETGAEVHGFEPGDQVIGWVPRLNDPFGAQADFVVLPVDCLAKVPAGFPVAAGSTIPLNGLTADQALRRLGLRPGQSVLITGAAGGVGGYAVELAVHHGLRVLGTATAEDRSIVEGLGAQHFIPRDVDLAPAVAEVVGPGGVDGVIDAAVVRESALESVADSGAFVTLVAGGQPTAVRGIAVSTVWTQPDGVRLAELTAMASRGELTPRVSNTYTLTDVVAAHRRFEQGRLGGHLLLVP